VAGDGAVGEGVELDEPPQPAIKVSCAARASMRETGRRAQRDEQVFMESSYEWQPRFLGEPGVGGAEAQTGPWATT
jgi:hypothetical protein